MKKSFALILLATFLFAAGAAFGQVDVARKTTAITYPLDDSVTVQFRGTTRFPRMKGEAKVKRTARSGSTIELSVEKMPRPFELGAGYATYVVWAISPTGQADNHQLASEIVDEVRRRAGQVDREAVANVIAARTNLSRAEADQLAGRVGTAVLRAKRGIANGLDSVSEAAGDVAINATDAGSHAA